MNPLKSFIHQCFKGSLLESIFFGFRNASARRKNFLMVGPNFCSKAAENFFFLQDHFWQSKAKKWAIAAF